MKVLVDTSIWINHFRSSNNYLEGLLDNTEVACHPLIVGELACGNLRNRKEIITLLSSLPMAPEVEYDEALEFIEINKLMGKGIGFIDVLLLASSRLAELPIWTNNSKLKHAAQELQISYAKRS